LNRQHVCWENKCIQDFGGETWTKRRRW